MPAFFAIAALLGVIVFALMLRPLWKESRALGVGLGLLALLSVGLLYRLVGTPQALDPTAVHGPQTVAEAIAQLEAVQRARPDQLEGWILLGQVYQRSGELAKARDAFAKAVALAPDNPDVLAAAAQTRAQAEPSGKFDAQAMRWLDAALKINPEHQRARLFLGMAQRLDGKNAQASATWEPLLAQVDAATAAPLREQINLARADAGLPPLPEPTAPAPLLRVKVSLDPALIATLPASASIFVIARQIGGAPIPVAAQKHAASALPFTAELSDADSPMPNLKLSQVRQVELLARITLDGNANPAPGAPESQPVQVNLPATAPITLVIRAP